jgi:hypothetical protein
MTCALFAAAGSAGAATSGPNEVLSIEKAQGSFQILGRGFLNLRVQQGTVFVEDLTPSDRFSPYLGGVPVPRGKSSGTTGNDVRVRVLGGRYRISVRGSGVSISARGDGFVVMSGEPDDTGNAGTIRIGDAVRPIALGESKAAFGVAGDPSAVPTPAPVPSGSGDRESKDGRG